MEVSLYGSTGERWRLTQVEVVHAVGHQDVVEEDQTWVVDAFIEPVCSVCSVHVFLCKEPQSRRTEGDLIQNKALQVLPPSTLTSLLLPV